MIKIIWLVYDEIVGCKNLRFLPKGSTLTMSMP